MMTPTAKKALSSPIRALRERLVTDLDAALERAYLLQIPLQTASLDARTKDARQRLEAWLSESPEGTAHARREVVLTAASTWLNRLVLQRILEARGAPEVVRGGWQSSAYKDFRDLAPALCRDETEGYRALLDMVFAERAVDLPGLFEDHGLTALVPLPPATLRHLVESLDDEALDSCWTDPLCLGWVYQYWNDPERERLDDQLNQRKKLQNHQIASKTQMFTERYMVDWMLQNALGLQWLAICRKNGWIPEVQSLGVLDGLEHKRAEHRRQREAGELPLTQALVVAEGLEARWQLFVPQDLPEDAVEHAPDSVRDLKILDPAVGSGHFLVVAFDLLFALHQEEARHRGEAGGERWTDQAIARRILEHTLHGVDLDPRAVQIAAASLWLKATERAPDLTLRRLNLVASNLDLARLPASHPARRELVAAVERETGLPEALTAGILEALEGADHLGSLLKVDVAVAEALDAQERALTELVHDQGDLFEGFAKEQPRRTITREQAAASVLDQLESFLDAHTGADDLGLRLHGEQLAAGVRFIQTVREGRYHLVVGNPPYQGTSKMADADYVKDHYALGKADLFAAFLIRGLELAREGGTSALLTMRNWMFIKQYSGLREWLLEGFDLRGLGDFDRGAFEDVPDEVVSVCASLFRVSDWRGQSVAMCPTPREDTSRDSERTQRKRAAVSCQTGVVRFEPGALKVVPEWPLVYWWGGDILHLYGRYQTIGTAAPASKGLCTCNDVRFLRCSWEVQVGKTTGWVPSIHGSGGTDWYEPLRLALRWHLGGLELKNDQEYRYNSISKHVRSPHNYFKTGVAFAMIGSNFGARIHRYPSIYGNMGSSTFPPDPNATVCSLNSSVARNLLTGLNPSVHFEVGDVNRLPLFPIESADDIVATLDAAFTIHESHREASVEYTHPGPSPWRHAQDWAQLSVDRPAGAPLPEYIQELDPEPPEDHLYHALGVCLGRFGPNREGILDPTSADLSHALPHGILFLSHASAEDSLTPSPRLPPAERAAREARVAPLHAAWATHGAALKGKDLRTWLAKHAFDDPRATAKDQPNALGHLKRYENKPIHWPLTSRDKTFVAWITIHRMDADTLRHLLADHLLPEQRLLQGQRDDLAAARASADATTRAQAESRFATLSDQLEELAAFIHTVEQCAERGPDSPTAKTTPREQDARYDPDLDDGVMINSAALWPLLEPQWKKPKKWYAELAAAKPGSKDYDWSHLAARYWPARVDKKCQEDPSLAVAHGCFWTYHPDKAYRWELRLQDEIGPDFTLDEEGSDAARRELEQEQPDLVQELRQREWDRRVKKWKKAVKEAADGEEVPLPTEVDGVEVEAGLFG